MLYSVVQTAYNATIRPFLPRKIAYCNGVAARFPRLLDQTDMFYHYKAGLIDAIHEEVQPGDHVVEIGGGRGVVTVHCARAGAERITVFEAAAEMIPRLTETLDINGADADIDIRHALVGPALNVYGEADEADAVRPGELPAGDVLVLDCEGAERDILPAIGDYRAVICESHPGMGAPATALGELLAGAGYDISYRQFEPDSDRPEKQIVVAGRE